MPVASSTENGWTGGQYSAYRAIFGLYLAIHFAQLVPWGTELFSSRGVLPTASASPLIRLFPNVLAAYDAPWFVAALLIASTAFGVCFAIGLFDRAMAVAMWYVLACLFGRNPLIANPALPFVGWLLLAHAFLPATPYGSWAARRRVDPDGGWRMPQGIYLTAWALMALGYTYSGYTKLVSPSWVDGSAMAHVLANPLARDTWLRGMMLALPPVFLKLATWGGLALELCYAPLALFRRVRPWIWTLMVLMHLGLIILVNFAELTIGMLILHLFTFDPAWLSRKEAASAETVFFDGHCGLCHGFVRFVLAEDAAGARFHFSPLQGEAFNQAVSEERRAGLPDSIVLKTAEGALEVRSRAVLHILWRLGGLWRAVAAILSLLPAPVRDFAYDRIARVRRHLFKAPSDACPLMPPGLRTRFHA